MKELNENNLNEPSIKDLEFFEKLRDFTGYEKKIFDLQKESFSNTRNLIIAAATISSVDLIAFEALKELNLDTWFLISVLLLYLSCVLFSMYLTSSNNFQVKRVSEDNDLFKNIESLLNDPELKKISKIGSNLDSYIKKIEKRVKFSKNNSLLFTIGNISFILGLVIPIIGLVVYFIK